MNIYKKVKSQSNRFSMYMKIPTEYYRRKKETFQKQTREWYQNLSEEEKIGNLNMVASDIKIFSEEE